MRHGSAITQCLAIVNLAARTSSERCVSVGAMQRRQVLLVVVAMSVIAACLHAARVAKPRSNVASLALTEHGIVEAASRKPYTGTLVATGAEIKAVATYVFAKTPWQRGVGTATFDGFVLALPVKHGVVEGHAELSADLAELKRSDSSLRAALALHAASALSSTVKIAEATFKGGMLDGVATGYAHRGEAPVFTTYFTATFVANQLQGEFVEYYSGAETVWRRIPFAHGVRDGRSQEFFLDGTVATERNYADGNLHGAVLGYYKNRQLRERSTYAHGELTGTAEAWFPDGKPKSVSVPTEQGRKTTTWYSNGQVASEQLGDNVTNFPPNGSVTTYYLSGAVESRTSYAAGVQDGAYERFYKTGQLWERGMFRSGLQEGLQQRWWKNGVLALEAHWQQGQLDGGYARWYSDKTNWEVATYQQGKLVGTYQTWWRNGARAADYTYVDGKLNGPYRTYYDNGAKWAVAEYRAGKPQGTVSRWFPDGRLGYEMQHQNGRPHGTYQRWYANGKPRLVGHYVRGNLQGELKKWREDGAVADVAMFEKGNRVGQAAP